MKPFSGNLVKPRFGQQPIAMNGLVRRIHGLFEPLLDSSKELGFIAELPIFSVQQNLAY